MQTFLPSTLFKQSAKWLDNQRLGKQRVECMQILKALSDSNYGWQNHPAVNMWRGYEWSLWGYAAEIIYEWKRRGYKDTCWLKICKLIDNFDEGVMTIPPWLTEDFASNHRAILLGKAYESDTAKFDEWIANYPNTTLYKKFEKAEKVLNWYQSLRWTEQPATRDESNKWPYIWPVKE